MLDSKEARPYTGDEILHVLGAVVSGLSEKVAGSPVEPLTSREVAKLTGSVLGGLLAMTSVDAIMDAIDHFHEHREVYRLHFKGIKELLERASRYQAPLETGHT